ncbi:Uncharacterized protein MJ1055 [Geodia barretti]|uniref:Uncharacterized protein MJ1055 n=1 Tax=Geodia barretti TaxID=519541 RepID=A0AA35SMQ2_GEOBA|nr:Uncharacterized protein MJ1055 [Geodia barretti]
MLGCVPPASSQRFLRRTRHWRFGYDRDGNRRHRIYRQPHHSQAGGTGPRCACSTCSQRANLQPLLDRISIYRGDVTRMDHLLEAINSHNVDRIIHMAALLPPDTEDRPATGMAVNIDGTNNVFEAARWGNIQRVVYASSIAVYGVQDTFGDRPLTEDDLAAPINVYGMTKAVNDFAAARYRTLHGLDIRGVRICTVFGHGRVTGMTGMIGGLMMSLPAIGQPVEMNFDPREASPMIHTEDAAEIFVRVALADQLSHHIYISGGELATIADVADIVRSYIPDASIRTGDRPVPHVYLVDNSRMMADVGYELPPLRMRVLDHINDARAEAGLEPISGYVPGAFGQGGNDPSFLRTLVELGDKYEYDSIWLSDRICSDRFSLEPMVALSLVAGYSERLKFGTSVLALPLRNPVVLAKQVATLDWLSQGRFFPAVGLGQEDPDEYEACGVPKADRARRTDEAIGLMRRLWQEEYVTHEGDFFTTHNVSVTPRTRLAKPKSEQFVTRQRPDAHFTEYSAVGTSEQIGDFIEQYVDAGGYKFVIRPLCSGTESMEQLEQAGEEILPRFHGPLSSNA